MLSWGFKYQFITILSSDWTGKPQSKNTLYDQQNSSKISKFSHNQISLHIKSPDVICILITKIKHFLPSQENHKYLASIILQDIKFKFPIIRWQTCPNLPWTLVHVTVKYVINSLKWKWVNKEKLSKGFDNHA